MRRWWHLLVSMMVLACTTAPGPDTTEPVTTTPPTEPPPSTTTTMASRTTEEILEELGGTLCPESEFTCVTLEMPFDHADPSDGRTHEVTFAILPAAGEARGAFITATGGPGGSGISAADSYTSALDPAIPGSYDIVFFDQRGLALSGGLTCPIAAADFYRVDALGGLGLDEESLVTASAKFADACVTEMGDPEVLPYLGTEQVVEDLSAFIEVLDLDNVVLYGESYGTQVAQSFAATHGDQLSRLVLDGTVDLTLDGFTFFEQQSAAFGDSLQATFDYCAEDETCLTDMGGPAGDAYDRMLALLLEGPLPAEFPLPGGGFASRELSVGDLEEVASGQMYTEDDRMMFLRALSAFAERDDLVPMLRLLYLSLGVDPVDLSILEDPTWSDAIYYSVECLDYHFPGTTPEEKVAAFLDAGEGADLSRLGSLFYGDMPCAFWPATRADPTRPEALRAEGIPTLVLGATADPATPYAQGAAVADRLDQGHLITKEGGPHVIFGWGDPCPDEQVTAFILDGIIPEQSGCEGEVVGYYIPLLPAGLAEFESAEAMLDAVEYEILYLPEYYWWDAVTDTSVGCHLGGTLTISATDEGDLFGFDECALMDGLALDGEGFYDWEEDVFTFEIVNGGPACAYYYQRAGFDYTVEDNCEADPFP